MLQRRFAVLALCASLLPQALAAQDASKAIQPVDPQLGRPVEFYKDVFPFLEANCLACHNVQTSESDLVLESPASILKGGASGPSVVAGKPDESLLYELAARANDPVMPPMPNKAEAKPLTPQQLGILRKWIEEGAQVGNAPPPSSVVNWQAIPPSVRSVFSIALSPDARFVAAGRANRIVVYDLTTKSEVAQLTDPALLTIQQDGKPMYGVGTAHRDFVHSLAFSPDGNLLASGGYRETKLWQRIANVQTHQLPAGANVSQTVVSPDGTWGALVLGNNTVRLFNLTNGQPGATLTGHENVVHGAAFSPDGKTVATVSEDGTLRTWNAENGQLALNLKLAAPATAVLFSKDGMQLIAGQADGIRTWAIPAAGATEPGMPAKELKAGDGAVTGLVHFPASNEIFAGYKNGTYRIWNLDNGSQPFSQNLGTPVTGIGVSADGQILAIGGENGNLRIINRNGQQVAEVKGNPGLDRAAFRANEELTVAKSKATLADTAVKESEKEVTAREESLKKAMENKTNVDKAAAEAQKKVDEEQPKVKAAEEALAAKPDDAALKKAKEDAEAALKKLTDARDTAMQQVASADRAIQLAQQSLENAKKRVIETKQRLEGAQAVSKQTEDAANAAKQTAAQGIKPVRSVAFSKDGKTIAVGGDDGLIQLWSASGKPMETLTGHGGAVTALTFSPAGTLLSGSADQKGIVWSVQPTWNLAAVLGAKPDNTLDVSMSPFVDRVLALAFSPDGQWLATGGGDPSRSGELLLWNVAGRSLAKPITDAHSDTVYDVEFSRDGQFLVSGGADKFVKVFNVASGQLVRSYEGHTSHVLGVAFKADGSLLASSGADNAIKIWNVETGEQARTISNYAKQVTSVGFVGVSDVIVSGGGDKTVRFHNVQNGGQVRAFGGMTEYVYTVAATPDEEVVIAAGEDGIIRVWNGKNAQELGKFDPPAPPVAQQAAK
ncbi:WD40 repeat domain-containing protein [Planctomyces sp. SH-PL14]|uniref:WD40 repeat domain-containing protein n=1 Tax=Planctomyces sp. SH-PL14 TaxID=1632864 RepID=UPI00078EDF24|nr:c-type cytochrome domain-containing protein [Planctomyces sp. SH-PL14]AMV17782.1 WD domain, G-beta repeat [Planctomyces sp. SH-PL14]